MHYYSDSSVFAINVMIMSLWKTIVTNIWSIFLWAVFALSVFYVVYDSDFLTADILQQNLADEIITDFSVTSEKNTLTVYANKDFPTVDSVEFLVDFGFDNEQLRVDPASIQSDYAISHVLQQWQISLLISDVDAVSNWQSILRFDFDGDTSFLVLESFRMFVNGEEENVTIQLPPNTHQTKKEEWLHY